MDDWSSTQPRSCRNFRSLTSGSSPSSEKHPETLVVELDKYYCGCAIYVDGWYCPRSPTELPSVFQSQLICQKPRGG
ncbi:hypothetical protein RRG08_015370 [Elysia crispata]|uniref:Uncharacterized protein n=1 Tax=Elysia crispata TaxID=231223 RepID=A0AAE1A819_9GAST|nr:hypothetical protein RRG08_015370 [Elysia crispata]